MMRAYFPTPRISVLADYPCYHWVLRDRDVERVVGPARPGSRTSRTCARCSTSSTSTPSPGPFRDRLYARWYRGKMLNRVEKVHSNPDRAHRRALYEAMHELAVERFPEGVDAFLPFNLQRARGCCAPATTRGWRALADSETAAARARRARSRCARRRRRRAARWRPSSSRLRFQRDGERVVWATPADATAALDASTVQLLLKQRATQEEYRVPAEAELRLVDAPDGGCARCSPVSGARDRGHGGRRRAAPAGAVGGPRDGDRRRLPRGGARAPGARAPST